MGTILSIMDKMQPTPKLAKTIAVNLGRLIDKHPAMSQRELAKDIGIPTMVLNRAINGVSTPAADAIVKMAQYYGVSTDYILGLSKVARNGKKLAKS